MIATTQTVHRGLLALALVAAAAIAACGGGGGSSATGSFSMGRIAGFGSIIVNGVHYDDSTATVEDEDGQSASGADLKLGMVVEVQGGGLDQSGTNPAAQASHVTMVSLMKGPVEAVGADNFTVLGQTVQVSATTVFDDSLSGGLSALTVGSVVKVYGTLDGSTGIYTATRVEPKHDAVLYSLRGLVASIDNAAHTLTIGTTVIDISGVSVPSGVDAGSLVRVKLQTTQVGGKWVAESMKLADVHPQDVDHAEVEGSVSAFTSSASFSVDGLPVDASNAEFPDGKDVIVLGARVEVEGAIVNGVLVATQVELKSDQEDAALGFEVDGAITAVDANNSTITVRGVTVKYGSATAFANGSTADLAVGTVVQAHGTLAADGVTLDADRIEIVQKP